MIKPRGTNPEIADFIAKHIDIQAVAGRTARQIAVDAGYKNPNMISMLKTGTTKVPLEKIPALARALRVNAALLFRLALEQYWPKKNKVVGEIFGTVLTANETVMIKALRKGSDPAVTEKQRQALERLFDPTL